MLTQLERLNVVSNNIANANTTGFRRDIVVTQSFSEELTRRLDTEETSPNPNSRNVGKITYGVAVNNIHTDFSLGAIRPTGGALELALNGNGFFTVGDAQGQTTRLTRDGSFMLSGDRHLVTAEGNYVMGENGLIQLPEGLVTINDKGQVYVGETYIDRLKLVDVENTESLRKYGDNLYNTTEQTNLTTFNGTVQQGALESSNINTVREMVELISISRNYEANQKLIQYFDTSLGTAVTDIGRKL